MDLKVLAAVFAAATLMAVPVRAGAACCDQQSHTQAKPCCDMPCCKEHRGTTPVSIVEENLAADPQLNPAPPVRQTAEVWFKRPTLVGRSILQGRYVIEHDNNRMARGEPCTHIYAFHDRTRPVVKFNCTHLERERAGQNQVVVFTAPDGVMQQLAEFQFAGETAAHGYPTVR